MARSVHIVVRLLAGLSALVVVILALLAARLSTGPVSLAPIKPVIESALGAQTSYRFRIGDGDLLWLDWRRGLRVHLSDVELSREDGAARGHIESVAIAFSPDAMAHGALAPSSVEVNAAALVVKRAAPGPWPASPTVSRAGGASLTNVLAGLRSPPDPRRPVSYLSEARIKDVVMDVEGAGADALRVRIDDAGFIRDEDAALRGEASIVLSQAGEDAAIGIDLGSESADPAVDGEVTFSNLRPAAFSGLGPEFAPMAVIDTPLTGKATLDFAPDGTPAQAVLYVSGGPGALMLSEPMLKAAGLASPEQRLPLRSMALRAAFAPPANEIAVHNATLVFEPGTMVYVPAPVDHRFPLSLLSGRGSFTNGRLSLPSLAIDLDGLQMTASAAVDDVVSDPTGTASLSATNVKVDDFRRYWPPKAAPGAYRWCTQHLRDGIVPRLRARLAFASHHGQIEVTSLNADFGVERLTVDHLPPMPPVRDARGIAKIDLKTMTIDLAGGRSAGLTVTGGKVFIPDLERDVPSIDIDVSVAGPVRDAMDMIASKPLTYPQKIGLSPEQTSGEMTARLRLGFPLLAALKLDEMDIRAGVDLTNAGVTDVAKGVGISKANVHLDIDTARMRAAGRLAVADMEGSLDLAYSFTADADPQTRMEFVTDDVGLSRLRQSFPELAELDSYLLGGSFDARLLGTVAASGQGNIQARLDLGKTNMAVPYLRWRKDAGPPATLDVVLQTHGERLTAVPSMSFSGPDMEVKGSLRMHPEGGLERLDLDRLISGRNDASAAIAKLADGQWDITVRGESIDLQPLISSAGEGVRESGSTFVSFPDLAFAADVNAVWLGGPEPIGNVIASLVHDGGLWNRAQMQGRLTDGSTVEFSVIPADGQGRTLQMTAGNAGEALRAFEIFPDMIGGRMSTDGRFDDGDPAHPLRAKLRVKNFHIVNTPILARLLGLLSLGGIRDALTGKGIHFSTLDMPFRARKGVIAIDNGKAFGSALGMTFSGAVDTNAETLDMQGEVVPFYAVNSAIGHVPLVGDIMTGGEEGGGIFSASYRVVGPLEDPQVSVNPVTVLFPGFLRWILETFEGWVSPEAVDGTGEALPDEP